MCRSNALNSRLRRHRCSAWLAGVCVLVGLFLAPLATVHAQQVTERSDQELRDDGWVVDRRASQKGSLLGGLLAMTVGFAWHGVGHFYVGERITARRLVAAEAMSVALLLGGAAVQSTSQGEAGRAAGRTMVAAGASAFVVSWLADIVGAFKGTGSGLPINTLNAESFTVEVNYTLLLENGLDITNLAVLRLPLVTRRVVFVPAANISTDLDYRFFSAFAGYRQPLRSDRRDAFLEFGGGASDEYFDSAGAGRTQLRARVLWSWDLGAWANHLDGLVWRTGLNLTADHFYFDSQNRRRLQQANRIWALPAEFSFSANVNRDVNVSMGYHQSRDMLGGGGGSANGAFYGRLSVVPLGRIGVDLMVERGRFTRLGAGLRYVVSGRRQRLDENARVQ
jgi:hypothetical protein